MRAIAELVAMVVVVLAAFGVWSMASPDAARQARDGTVRVVDRLSQEYATPAEKNAGSGNR